MGDLFARQYINQIVTEKGEKIRIAFLGGSLTKGEKVETEQCFVSLFEKRIREQMPEKKIEILRYGESGTMSSNGLYKVERLVAEKPDLVFLDYAMNDTGDRYLWETTEGILYQLQRAGAGVVVLLFCNEYGTCTRGAMERAGAHYHVPVCDIGAKIFSEIQEGKFTWQMYAQDYVHPTAFGHEKIAEELLRLFQPPDGQEKASEAESPGTFTKIEPFTRHELSLDAPSAFTGALRRTRIWDLSEALKEKEPGAVIYDGELEMKMLLMEFFQNCVKNDAHITIALDGETKALAEAYAVMAWGNPVCRYVGGDGQPETHRLTITLGKGKPPAGWDYEQFQLRLLIGY